MMVPFRISLTGTKACVGLAGEAAAIVSGLEVALGSTGRLHIKGPRKLGELAAREPRGGSYWRLGGSWSREMRGHLRLLAQPEEELRADVVVEASFDNLDEGLAVDFVERECARGGGNER